MSPLEPALPRELYVDESAWVTERDRVLFGEWFCVGRVDDLGLSAGSSGGGRLAVVDVVGESVLVTRDSDGVLHAAYNVCRHRGAQLVATEPGAETSTCAVGALRCPYHSWTYSLAGELLRAPHADLEADGEQSGVDAADFALYPVGIEEWFGFVMVHLTPRDAAPLGDAVDRAERSLANYAIGDLVIGATLTYDVAANYKVVAENYNECYHCGPVHPELSRLVPAFAGGGVGLEWEDGIPHREGAWTFTMSGTTTRASLPGLSEAERTRHKGELIHPNLMLSCAADHVAAFVLRPQGVARTRIDCLLLFAADEVAAADFDPSDAVELWDLVNRQDWAICESVQRGMSSRSYRHGWFAPMEDDSADIRRWLLPRLEERHD